MTTLAGLAGTSGSADGTGSAARFDYPYAVAVDSMGTIFVADTSNHTIRGITPAGVVTTLAGLAGTMGSADGTGSAARFADPRGVAVDSAGNVFVADTSNDTIRRITPAGVVTTLAGLAGTMGSADGTGSAARFEYPWGMAVDGLGNVYVADEGNDTIRKVTPAGVVTTLAGSAGEWGSADGAGSAARFFYPEGVAVDSLGNVFVADTSNETIRQITPAGVVTTIGGVARVAGSVDGVGDGAQFNDPTSLALDSAGNIYVADTFNCRITKGVPLAASGAPRITLQPQSLTVAAGTGVGFIVLAAGAAPLSYQWQFGGVNVTNGGPFSGATTSNLLIRSVSGTNAGTYQAVVSNSVGVVASAVAVLTVTPPAGPLSFAVGTNSGARSAQVLLPVQVTHFTQIASFQFSLHWDAAVARYVGVEQFGLSGLTGESFGTNLTKSGTLTVSWDDPGGGSQSLEDGTTVFALRLALIGKPGAASPLTINSTPVPLQAANGDLALVPVQTLAGLVSIAPATVSIGGRVLYYPTNYPSRGPSAKPVGGVTVTLEGVRDTNTLTAKDGSYKFPSVIGSLGFEVTPAKADDTPAARGVTTLDLILIRQHMLGNRLLDSPYKLLAADADGSGTITTVDIALLRRLVLGLTNDLPMGLWRFVPADHVFADPTSPWHAPTNRWYTNLVSNLSGQDFVAIKLGDVNGSWTEPLAAQLAAGGNQGTTNTTAKPKGLDLVRLQASADSAQPHGLLTARVTAGAAHDLTTAQFTLTWDPTILRYRDIEQFGLPGLSSGNFGLALANQGKLTFSWDDPGATGVTIADGSVVFAIDFDVIGQPGSASSLTFADAPTVREASVAMALAAMETQNGSVTVLDTKPVVSCSLDPAKGMLLLSLPTDQGVHYVVEFTDSLSATAWTALTAVLGDGTIKTVTDAATNHQRFYRLRIPAPFPAVSGQ